MIYTITKHGKLSTLRLGRQCLIFLGLMGMTKNDALDFAKNGIRINTRGIPQILILILTIDSASF